MDRAYSHTAPEPARGETLVKHVYRWLNSKNSIANGLPPLLGRFLFCSFISEEKKVVGVDYGFQQANVWRIYIVKHVVQSLWFVVAMSAVVWIDDREPKTCRRWRVNPGQHGGSVSAQRLKVSDEIVVDMARKADVWLWTPVRVEARLARLWVDYVSDKLTKLHALQYSIAWYHCGKF